MQIDPQKPVYILNGPNLNLLGFRQPEIYGKETLADIEALCAQCAEQRGLTIDFRQSNSEGECIEWIHEARTRACALIINPAAYSHTSIAIMDALFAVTPLRIFEVHLSNIHKREAFRHHSYVSRVADAVICGLGAQGYIAALEALA